MGVKQKYIKRTALKLMKEHSDEFTDNFEKNRDALENFVNIQSNLVKNQIAGYIVRLKKRKVK